mmetsp:Transcript_22421/g.55589  ORF Transcript_22421/g.55589 Transcript_22421/m.55589 type:complete len:106 (+) Transcript_22421:1125-1442(+)
MPRNHVRLLVLFANLASVFAFAPMMPMASEVAAPVVESISKSIFSGADSILLSVVEESEIVTKQDLINWDNPGEAIIGSITFLYIAFSIAAGIKYVVVDGYRPKM